MLDACRILYYACSLIMAAPPPPSFGRLDGSSEHLVLSATENGSDAKLAGIDVDLKNPDGRVRRRALWRLAHANYPPDLVVDRLVAANDFPSASVVTSIGKRGLPRLYYHLKRAEKGYERYRVFVAITMLGEPDDTARKALNREHTGRGEDADLDYLLSLLKAGASPGDEARRVMAEILKQPLGPTLAAGGDGPLWPFVIYGSTRDAALDESRDRLRRGLATLAEGGTPDFTAQCTYPLFALFVAARFGLVISADASLLDNPLTGASKLGWRDSPPLPLLMARWRAHGRGATRQLDEVLRASGAPRPSEATLGYMAYVANQMVDAKDAASFAGRAADRTADEDVRVGAIRFLALLGALSDDEIKLLLRLTTDGSDRLSSEAATAIGAVLADDRQTAQLARRIQALVPNEKRSGTRGAIQNSAEILLAGSRED